jgi:hypothetical protein
MTTITIYFFPKQATKAKASDEYNIVVMMEVIVSSSLPPSTRDGVAYLLVTFGAARNNEHNTRYCQQLTCRWLVGCLLKRMLLFLLNEKKEHPSIHPCMHACWLMPTGSTVVLRLMDLMIVVFDFDDDPL